MKTVNIYDFFPVENDETMEKYLKNDDQYEDRKNQLSTVLINALDDKTKSFSSAMIKAIFHPNYMATHRWPTIK